MSNSYTEDTRVFASCHNHSVFSDAEYSPEKLVELAHEMGHGGIILTDHDTVRGTYFINKAARKVGMKSILGCEFTTYYGEYDTHLLGFDFNPDNRKMKALLDYVQPLVESGELWLPDSFTEAAKYYFEWSSASLDAKACSEDCIELSLTAGEDEHLGERLTVEVSLPDAWEAAELTSYGRCERLTPRLAADGSRFVYVNILPGKEISVLRRIP